MAQLSHAQMARAGASAERYHPRCGDQHRHKPAKALIGIALLIALSVLLYAVTGRAGEMPAGGTAQQIHGSR